MIDRYMMVYVYNRYISGTFAVSCHLHFHCTIAPAVFMPSLPQDLWGSGVMQLQEVGMAKVAHQLDLPEPWESIKELDFSIKLEESLLGNNRTRDRT